MFHARHDSADKNCNKEATQSNDKAYPINEGKNAVPEKHTKAAKPRGDEVNDKDLPALRREAWVVQGVYRHYDFTIDVA